MHTNIKKMVRFWSPARTVMSWFNQHSQHARKHKEPQPPWTVTMITTAQKPHFEWKTFFGTSKINLRKISGIKHAENFFAPNLFQAIPVLSLRDAKRKRRWRKCEEKGSYPMASKSRGCRRRVQRLRGFGEFLKNSEEQKCGNSEEDRGSFYVDHTRTTQRSRLRQRYMILRLQFKDGIRRQYYDEPDGSFI